tara:strand:- start:577 stop:717 length:141 start_codon:yes stop_codon:yes gene_type:complete
MMARFQISGSTEMKIILSIPKRISRNVRVSSETHALGLMKISNFII